MTRLPRGPALLLSLLSLATAATATSATASAATTPAAPGTVGTDVSRHQAGTALPPHASFAVVDVTGANFGQANPELATQWAWADRLAGAPQLYLVPANVVGGVYWHKGGPQACTGARTVGCSYDYGFVGAQQAVAWARAGGLQRGRKVAWWIDVEDNSTWDNAHPVLNAAVIRGVRDALLRSGSASSVGIYTIGADWRPLVGAASGDLATLPVWAVGGARTTSAQAKAVCNAVSPTGGPIVMGQSRGAAGGADVDVVCPVKAVRQARISATGTAALSGTAFPGSVVRLTVVQRGRSARSLSVRTTQLGRWSVVVRSLAPRSAGTVQVSRSSVRIALVAH